MSPSNFLFLQALYGRYATESSGESIQCPPVIFGQITTHLWPAYEDLFDAAEEHVLGLLLEQWLELRSNDERIFQKVYIATVCRIVGSIHGRKPLQISQTYY